MRTDAQVGGVARVWSMESSLGRLKGGWLDEDGPM